MDIRNVQKTGNMFYVYLPTAWCKKFGISSKSELRVSMQSDGAITFNPVLTEPKPKHIDVYVDETNLDVINKIIVACYINPASSFKIHLKEKLDQAKLLHQKKLVSIELIEMDGNTITCESSVSVSDPEHLLRTILSKVKNMLLVTTKSYNKELIERYEEEIDRNRLLIEKATINALTFRSQSKTKVIYLYYISQLTRELERMADRIILIGNKETKYLDLVIERIDMLRGIVDKVFTDEFNSKTVIDFSKLVAKLPEGPVTSVNAYNKRRIKDNLDNICDVLMDWAITNEVEK